MSRDNKIQVFEDKKVRMEWDENEQDWYLSIVDVVSILTEQPTHGGARKYWSVLKTRLKQEGNEPTTICSQLKMLASDGKMRLTDVASLSKEANPFGISQTAEIAKQGGSVAKAAREQYEMQAGESVISPLNAIDFKALEEANSANN